MKSIEITIHSVVDLITNSSSEIFVTTNEKTVELVKSILKVFLDQSGNPFNRTVDELFKVENVYKWYNENDEYVDMVGSSECTPSKIRVTIIDSDGNHYSELVNLLNKLNDVFVGETFMT